MEKDQVQVSLAYDVEGGGKRWFAYSTPYSSPDGTGWYFMPEPGEEIRLHFPTQEEDAAYVVSSTHITHGNRSDPEVKFIRTQRRGRRSHSRLIRSILQMGMAPVSVWIRNRGSP